MSWPQWPTQPGAAVGPTALQPAVGQQPTAATPSVPGAPNMPSAAQYAAMTPEQQYALQQNWQQWQTYHQQYAQWHAQYGEQYQREMQAKMGASVPSAAGTPFPTPVMPSYTAPLPPGNTYGAAPPPPPPDQQSAQMTPSVNNYVAAASQPPPPPPPPEGSSSGKTSKAVAAQSGPQPPQPAAPPPPGPQAYPQNYNQPPPPQQPVQQPQQTFEQYQQQYQQWQQAQQQYQQQQIQQPPPGYLPYGGGNQGQQQRSNNQNAQHQGNNNFNPSRNQQGWQQGQQGNSGGNNQFDNQWNQNDRGFGGGGGGARNDRGGDGGVRGNNRNDRFSSSQGRGNYDDREDDNFGGGSNRNSGGGPGGNFRDDDRGGNNNRGGGSGGGGMTRSGDFGNRNNFGDNRGGDFGGGNNRNDFGGNNRGDFRGSNRGDFGGSGRGDFGGGSNRGDFGGGNNRGDFVGGNSRGDFGGGNNRGDFGGNDRGDFGGNDRSSFGGNDRGKFGNKERDSFARGDFGNNRGSGDFGGSSRGNNDFGGNNRSGSNDFGDSGRGPSGSDFGAKSRNDFKANNRIDAGGFANNSFGTGGNNSGSQSVTPAQNPNQIEGPDGKTPEERAFDEQFRKWEEEFENWKKQNVNHPDRKAYREYEMKFEDCRRRLLERREQMRKRKLDARAAALALKPSHNPQPAVPNVSPQNTGDAVQPIGPILPPSIFMIDEPTVTETLPIEKPAKQPEIINAPSEVIEQVKDNTEPQDMDEDSPDNVSESNAENDKPAINQPLAMEEKHEFLKTTSSGGIPGLDLVEGVGGTTSHIDERRSKDLILEKGFGQANESIPAEQVNKLFGFNTVTQTAKPLMQSKNFNQKPFAIGPQADNLNQDLSNPPFRFGPVAGDKSDPALNNEPFAPAPVAADNANKNLNISSFGFGSPAGNLNANQNRNNELFRAAQTGGDFSQNTVNEPFSQNPINEPFRLAQGGDNFNKNRNNEPFQSGQGGDNFNNSRNNEPFRSGPGDDNFNQNRNNEPFRSGQGGDNFNQNRNNEPFRSVQGEDNFNQNRNNEPFRSGQRGDNFNQNRNNEPFQSGQGGDNFNRNRNNEPLRSGQREDNFNRNRNIEPLRSGHGGDNFNQNRNSAPYRSEAGSDDDFNQFRNNDAFGRFGPNQGGNRFVGNQDWPGPNNPMLGSRDNSFDGNQGNRNNPFTANSQGNQTKSIPSLLSLGNLKPPSDDDFDRGRNDRGRGNRSSNIGGKSGNNTPSLPEGISNALQDPKILELLKSAVGSQQLQNEIPISLIPQLNRNVQPGEPFGNDRGNNKNTGGRGRSRWGDESFDAPNIIQGDARSSGNNRGGNDDRNMTPFARGGNRGDRDDFNEPPRRGRNRDRRSRFSAMEPASERSRSRSIKDDVLPNRSRSTSETKGADGINTRNPFRKNDRSSDRSIDSGNNRKRGDGNLESGDEYFKPAQVIDYQNKSNDNTARANRDNKDGTDARGGFFPAVKVVDYGHRPTKSSSASGFVPMKTIDYGHSSTSGSKNKPTDVETPDNGDNSQGQQVKTIDYGHGGSKDIVIINDSEDENENAEQDEIQEDVDEHPLDESLEVQEETEEPENYDQEQEQTEFQNQDDNDFTEDVTFHEDEFLLEKEGLKPGGQIQQKQGPGTQQQRKQQQQKKQGNNLQQQRQQTIVPNPFALNQGGGFNEFLQQKQQQQQQNSNQQSNKNSRRSGRSNNRTRRRRRQLKMKNQHEESNASYPNEDWNLINESSRTRPDLPTKRGSRKRPDGTIIVSKKFHNGKRIFSHPNARINSEVEQPRLINDNNENLDRTGQCVIDDSRNFDMVSDDEEEIAVEKSRWSDDNLRNPSPPPPPVFHTNTPLNEVLTTHKSLSKRTRNTRFSSASNVLHSEEKVESQFYMQNDNDDLRLSFFGARESSPSQENRKNFTNPFHPQQQAAINFAPKQNILFPAHQEQTLSNFAVSQVQFPAFLNLELPQNREEISKPQLLFPSLENQNTITIDEILLTPGRASRPKKICIIFRGPPGSGKSFVAKLIKEKEVEMGGSAPRLLSIDDYFMTETDKEEKCPKTGRKIIKKEMDYEYEKEMESTYLQYLLKSFKKTISDGLFDFIIVDCVNSSLRIYNEFYNNAKAGNFTPYTIDLLCDLETCLKRNIHQRCENDIKEILKMWVETPIQYIKLDVTSLLQGGPIQEVEMEDVSDMEEDKSQEDSQDGVEEIDETIQSDFFKSKWDTDNADLKLARLDGISKPFLQKKTAATLEDYLQIDGWEPSRSTSTNKKRVRWADIEEKRAQDKMRAIGFVVGQTDWKRMMDPTDGQSALTKTKFIERVKKRP